MCEKVLVFLNIFCKKLAAREELPVIRGLSRGVERRGL